MRHTPMRTLIAGAGVLALAAVGAPAATAAADPPESAVGCEATAPEEAIYLKGSGSSFSLEGWKNVFYLGGKDAADYEKEGSAPNVWHLVYTGDFDSVTRMQLTFTNGETFVWTKDQGPSVNAGGNNPGWVIAAPDDWEIAYVDAGNNNQSGSCVIAATAGQFNISGYSQGRAPAVGSLDFSIAATTQWQHTTSWEVRQQTLQPVWQQETREIYAPQYKKDVHLVMGTLVSRIHYADSAMEAPVGGTITGKNGKTNGFTYVTVDLDQLKEPGAVLVVPIGDSSFNANGKKKLDDYNRPIGYSYQVRLVGDNLVVSFDDHLISTQVAAHVSGDNAMPTAIPGAHTPNGDSVSVAGLTGKVRLFVHLEGITWFTPGELLGYLPVDTEVVSDQWVRDDLVTDDLVRIDSETETLTAPLTDLSGFQVTVKDANGEVVLVSAGDSLYRLDNLAVGTYSVILEGNGIAPVTVVVEVKAGETATVSFQDIVVIGQDTSSEGPAVHLDPVWLDKVYLPDVELDPVYLTEAEAKARYPEHPLYVD